MGMGGFVAGGAGVHGACVRGCAYICDPSFFMRCVLALRVVCAYISCLYVLISVYAFVLYILMCVAWELAHMRLVAVR
ncbi:hypothetical protein HMPREF9248_0354 [Fannyhessea vaginae PB189-T1-4]|uniref:Uncharacterized protein n=1 Tax=Fannyhessea vaginae PB189-T1-4 TaxID=866774 RepID=A0ABN0AZQ6_9ACTN|nr:hypothetical protein HMPREF9248_0354 [Fannyhessea vaginae PB189-T1-4]